MIKLYKLILIIILLILTICSICTINLIGIVVYGVTLYGVITKKMHILKAWYIGHVISIIISIIISVVSSVVVYVMMDVSSDSKDEYDEKEYNDLLFICKIAKITLIIAYIYTGFTISAIIYLRLYIKKTKVYHRQKKRT